MLTHVRAAIVSLVLFTVVTGVVYPTLVTVIAQLVFPNQANGSLIYRNRVETETDLLVGKREDLLRRIDGGWKIARRKIVLDQSVLLAKNLTFFF